MGALKSLKVYVLRLSNQKSQPFCFLVTVFPCGSGTFRGNGLFVSIELANTTDSAAEQSNHLKEALSEFSLDKSELETTLCHA